MSQINKFALNLFGGLIGDKPELQKNLRQAHIPTPADEYLATTILYSIIAGSVGFVVSYTVVGLLLELSFIYTLLIVLGAGLGAGLGTYGVGLAYPSLQSSNITAEMNRQLPNATLYLYSQTSGGVSLLQAFKSLSKQKEEYGEVTEEFSRIVERVEYFREDMRTAISNVAENTSSEKFREFLETLTSVVLTGSSLPDFFSKKHEEFRADAKLKEERDLETLGLLAESYVIALGLGPLLIIVMLIVISLMGMIYTSMLYAVVYGLIPFGTAAFTVLLDTILISPVERREEKTLEEIGSDYIPTEEKPEENGEEEKKSVSIGLFTRLKNLPSAMKENPYYILAISSSIAIIFALMEIFLEIFGLNIAGVAMAGAAIGLIPFIIAYEIQARKIKKVEERLPDFFRSLAGTLRAGLSLPRAIESLPLERLGILSSYAKRLQKDIAWGYPSKAALIKFGSKTKSGLASSVMTTITNAYEAGGDIAEVMDINAESIRDRIEMRTVRFNTMLVYTIIIYLTFGVYLISIYALTVYILGGMPTGPEAGGGVAAAPGGMAAGVTFEKEIFLHAGMIQGFCSGLIGGKFSSGKVMGGLKHSLIMMSIAYLGFTLFIL